MSDDVNPYNPGPPVPRTASSASGEYPLEIGFELQEEDEVAALVAKGGRIERPRMYGVSMAIGILLSGFALVAGIAGELPRDLSIQCLVFGVTLFLLGVWLRFGVARFSRRQIAAAVKAAYADPRQRKLGGWIRLSLSPAGIQQSAEHFESLWRWTAIERIEVAEELILFHLGAVQVLLVPKRAFQDEGHVRTFLDAARRFHRRALGDTSETPFYRTL